MTEAGTEASYIIQYVEKNGRNRGDPWSLRQTGVYSQTKCDGQSKWLFLQLSKSTRPLLQDKQQRRSGQAESRIAPFPLHAFLLMETTDNWAEYVQDISGQIWDLVSSTVVHDYRTDIC